MSVTITVDGIDSVTTKFDGLVSSIQNAGEGLLEAAMSTAYPEVLNAAAEVWNVRTGNYLGGWAMEQIDAMTISIYNDIEYAAPLEYGWSTRGGGFVDSPGVLIPAVVGSLDELAGAFGEWLKTKGG